MQLERQLSEHVRGHWAWTLGAGGGIATGVSASTGKWAATSELRVGAGMVRRPSSVFTNCSCALHCVYAHTCATSQGLSGTVVRQLSEKRHLRVTAKLGMAGADVEVGGGTRLGEDTSAALMVAVGTSGVILKLRITRGRVKILVPVRNSFSYML